MSDIPYDLLMSIQRGTMAYTWRGLPLLKSPFDLALFPMVLERCRPRTIIEIGSFAGGSAVWLAEQASMIGLVVDVISVDVEPPDSVLHPAVRFVRGDAGSLDDIFPVPSLEGLGRPWLVIDDASHRSADVQAVLEFFGPKLRSGDWLVVEDGILDDMKVADAYDGGPGRAIREFLAAHGDRFEADRGLCDYFGTNVTWNVDGYIRCRA